MKYAICGFVSIVIAIAIAGNWLYIPFSTMNTTDYTPIPHYPDDDPADTIYHSNITYIESKDLYYIEYNYIWLNASQHTPDTERIRIYIQNGTLHHISLSIHYEWMDTYDFTADGNHAHIYFSSVYHTPYTSSTSYITMGINRVLPMLLFLTIGLILFLYEILMKYRNL